MYIYITKITKTSCWYFLNAEVGLIKNNLFTLILILNIVRQKLGNNIEK